ncbi:M50 family metallopeptidase [Hydrocarboniphaga effusa]|jgi:hypothetical protein|uniref:M50 family metallopeptidase n=1 Tax=Hydrocarboniphaga effusa TaxID=243629 RepID=UPI00313774D0
MARRRAFATTKAHGGLTALIAASAATFALYLSFHLFPEGRLLLWPLVLLSTLVHELGHGLTALLLGGEFTGLYIWPDASGVALYSAHFGTVRRAAVAAVAAGGLLGPPLFAYVLFVAGRHPLSARRALGVVAIVFMLVSLLWARNLFGMLFIGALALALGIVSLRGSSRLAQFGSVFVGVQMALSVFSRGDYLFMREAVTAQGIGPSDTSQIAQALYLPFWFWGALIAVLSTWLLWHGLRAFAPWVK